MRTGVKVVLVLAFSMAALAHARSVMAGTAPIFEVPFDGSADAVVAGGKAQPIKAENLRYEEGLKGNAVLIGKDSLLEYATQGNLNQEKGSVTLWFKPNWRAADMHSDDKSQWHCLFSEPFPKEQDGKDTRHGSGAFWLWFWGPFFRGDISDVNDKYITAGAQGLDHSKWAHIAFTWDIDKGASLFMNGIAVGVSGDGDSPLNVKKGNDFSALKNKFQSFFVGSQEGNAKADGLIDDLRIYDKALAQDEVVADMARVASFRIDCLTPYLAAGGEAEIRWALKNLSTQDALCGFSWRVEDSSGTRVADGKEQGASLASGAVRQFAAKFKVAVKGEYKLIVETGSGPVLSANVWALGKGNPYLKEPGAKLEAKLIETIDFVKGVPDSRLVAIGSCVKGSLEGRSYFEAGPNRNDRFAVKVDLPEAGVPYLVEWDYPDDKLRTMEMLGQDALNPSNDYGLQAGVFCGDEYPLSMKTMTHRSILWARSVGIHFEDPAVGYDFGIEGQLMPDYEKILDRLIAYMKWSGQNILTYPAVWYHGRIGTSYQPRLHPDDYLGCILAKFKENGLGFMPTVNLQNISIPKDVVINKQSFSDGSLHNSPVMIFSSGEPNPGGWHGTPPNFNPLHPAVQGYVDAQIDEMIERYAGNPAFKGIVMHLTKHTIPWFGSIEAGYNDYNIDAFEKDTGVKVQADRGNPLRGKAYFDWLMANARDEWIQWRCQKLAAWYTAIAVRMAAKRSDLKLSLCSYNPTITDHNNDGRYSLPDFARIIDRESGIDAKLYEGVPNIIISQTIYPSDYRWTAGNKYYEANRAAIRDDHFKPGVYSMLRDASSPWINMHDRYFENSVGSKRPMHTWSAKNNPLVADWLNETSWRVSTLNPNENSFLEHFILPLRYTDVLGFTKGGFLIGTYGVERKLVEFAKAFRALPAKKFADLAGSTETTKVRSLKMPEGTWFYAVNTDYKPSSISIVFDRAPATVSELGVEQELKAAEIKLKVELAPLQLRAFKIPKGVAVVSAE